MSGLEILALAAWMALGSEPVAAARDAGSAIAARDTAASAVPDTARHPLAPGDSIPAPPDSLGAAPAAPPLRLRDAGNAIEGRPSVGPIEPSGVAADAFGRLFVSDASLHQLQRYDAHGLRLGSSGALGSDPGQLNRPGSVALLGTLNVAVLDRENRRVVTYDLFGHLQGTLIDLADAALEDQTGRVDAVALAADRGGAVYLLDQNRDRVVVFDFSGRYLRTLGGFGVRPGSFRGLAGLAAAPRGEIVTCERGGARLQRLDAGGRVSASWHIDVEPGSLALAAAVDDSGRVAVADERRGRLWVFDPDGRRLAETRGLEGPRALAFAPDGTLLVAEATAGRVRRFALERAPAAGAARGR